jgi:uncharacterized protein YbjT (DUF2867 family)
VSILIVEPDAGLGPELIRRLISEGDEVRVLIPVRAEAHRWQSLGAFVAIGDPLDADLVTRACQNVRTLVAVVPGRRRSTSVLQTLVSAAAAAGTGRVVVCTSDPPAELVAVLEASGLEYVILNAGRRGFLPRRGPDMAALAAAVSAADDLAGAPKMVVDLTREEGWAALEMPG